MLPVGTLVNYGRTFGDDRKTLPGAGVVTAFVQRRGPLGRRHRERQHGRLGLVVAAARRRRSSARRRSRCGCGFPSSTSSTARACSSRSRRTRFPAARGAGAIFKMNALLSAAGVPQIAGVHGDCIAGGGYMPIISDVVYMTEQAYMVIAGAALVKGAQGAAHHLARRSAAPTSTCISSRCADHRVPDDETLIRCVRARGRQASESGAATYYRYGADAGEPRFAPTELDGLVPGRPPARLRHARGARAPRPTIRSSASSCPTSGAR